MQFGWQYSCSLLAVGFKAKKQWARPWGARDVPGHRRQALEKLALIFKGERTDAAFFKGF
jgi:hypothetical protein